ncbi:MAG: hypothetical protein HC884_13415, partial [Chloroflexaceae bacterium]|nr:hypothetical protein [Chloroflexaceae bacterium]
MQQPPSKPAGSPPPPARPDRAPAVVGPLLREGGLLLALLVTLVGGLLVAANLPLAYQIDVGVEEGPGSDLPMLHHFNTPEHDEHGTYRWTQDGSQVRLPGLGHRPVVVQLDFIPVSPQVTALGPQHMDLYTNGQPLARLPVSQEGRSYALLLPPPPCGNLSLTFHTATFSPPDDPRTLGTPLTSLKVCSVRPPSLAAPSWDTAGQWLLAVLLFWGTMRLALKQAPGVGRWNWWLLAGVVFLVVSGRLPRPPASGRS